MKILADLGKYLENLLFFNGFVELVENQMDSRKNDSEIALGIAEISIIEDRKKIEA